MILKILGLNIHVVHVGNFVTAVSDFQVTEQNDTHITFSWSLPNILISGISYYQIHYLESLSTSNSSGSYRTFYTFDQNLFSSVGLNTTTYEYTLTTSLFPNYAYGEYLVWLYTSNALYSKQIEVQTGEFIRVYFQA